MVDAEKRAAWPSVACSVLSSCACARYGVAANTSPLPSAKAFASSINSCAEKRRW